MKKILIVDDEKIFLMITERILSSSYATVCASSAMEAIELYKREKPDMVLSDLRMPGMSGYELKQKLQEEYGEQIPFMFMTADTAEETESRGFDIGAMDFVQKPFHADILLKRVGNILKTVERIQGLKKAAVLDKMTGLLNKASAEAEISQLCKTAQGALLMIDLDNFKLVNDIYGHAMGDKILICFAEILKAVVRPVDVIGRLGGDEFIAFCRNVHEEVVIEKKSRFINKYLLDAAVELMGENMTIPLGASIGCVVVPDEGIEFSELREKADKALYAVKQNGKHGFIFYTDLSQNDEKSDFQPADITNTMKILGERGKIQGAFQLPFEQFRSAYQFLYRLNNNYHNEICILLFSVKENPSAPHSLEQAVEDLTKILVTSLRQSDIITQYGKNQCIVLLPETPFSNIKTVTERVIHNWKESASSAGFEVSFECGRLE